METAKANKGSMKTGLAYAMGSFGSNISWYIINNYLNLFYTDIVTLSASAISLIMIISRIWDAVNDPMMGLIVDRTKTRWGKFRPYLMFAPPFLAVFNILTFTVFPLEGVKKVVVCLLCYIGAGMAYTAINVPYNGLLNRLSDQTQVRMDYVATSQVASSIIQVILSMVIMPMLLFFSQSDKVNARGYFISVLICNLVMIPFFWICAKNCKEVVPEAPKKAAEKKSVKDSIRFLVKNKYMMMLLFLLFIGCIAVIGRMTVLSYYVIYVMNSYTLISVMFTTLTVTQLIGNVLLPVATRKFGKVRWFLIMMIVWCVSCVAIFFIPASNVGIIIAISAITGFATSSSSICFGMMADCITYGDYKFGVRDEGFVSSFQTLSVKLGQAIVGAVAIPLLYAGGYVPQAAQSAGTLRTINILVNLLPAILNFIAIIPMFWYKLDEKKLAEMSAELEKRNAEAASE